MKKTNIPQSASLYGKFFKTSGDSKLNTKEKRIYSSFNKGLTEMRAEGFSRLATSLSRFDPEIRNPLLQSENFYLPQQTTRTGAPNVELNRWFAYYFKYHPLVGNLISLHSQLPLSRFGFQGVNDPQILQNYEECADDMDMFTAMVDLLKTWFLFGESQPYLFWNEDLNRFDGITYLDTSFIDVFGHTFFHNSEGKPTRLYSLIPDDLLIELLATNHPKVRGLVTDNLPANMIQAIRENHPMLLHNFNTEMVLRSASPWDVRGTSVVLGCLKELLYEDKLREAQYAIAEGHVSPKWIWKLGQANEYMPTSDDITAFKDVLISANNDPQFNLVTHYALNLQVEGSSGRILPIVPEIKFIEERIMSALFSNKALVSGSGVTFSNASVALRALMSRYIPIRAMAENFFVRKVFMPIALANNYYERKQADLAHNVRTSVDKLIIPKFNWSHKQNLLDDANIKNMLVQLRGTADLPMKTICDALDLDYNEVKNYLRKEQGTVFDKPLRDARSTAIGAAATAQTANITREEGKHVWLELLKKFFYWALPEDRKQYKDVIDNIEDTPDETGAPSDGDTGSEKPPAPGAPGVPGVPDEVATPEENAEVPEVNTDKPLGASKNLPNAYKEAESYFEESDNIDNKRKLKSSVEQFDFLRNASRNTLNELHMEHGGKDKSTGKVKILKCNNNDCNWVQDYFLNTDVNKHLEGGTVDELNLSEDRLQTFQKVVGNMKWRTLDAYNKDTNKTCPSCKTGKIIEDFLGDEKDVVQ